MFIMLDDAGNIFMQAFFPWIYDKRPTIFDGENVVDVNLGICVCHLI